ncbi:hypothetical protein CAPTEDRAFT_201267 [Capitella teleta]|uniref:Uncharacterized protein n=1 Tax=Capitella teleta TaxID=283909 RepID=R7T994_CAPTE|nr:hypothetical protein CAPTEDRAFT_201267 [Capitella teleta]|eukprot:ELT87975.1 hypothetical protein CAPTEDRAFT_201267 [Capitella teleta]
MPLANTTFASDTLVTNSATETTDPFIPRDQFLMWEAWTAWTICFFKQRFERFRIKLCDVTKLDAVKGIDSTCKQNLLANFNSHQIVVREYRVHSVDQYQMFISIEYATEREECVPDVDGTWMDWTDWSTCSASCGAGIKHRKRTCDGQSGNGRKCPGNDLHNDFCVEAECPTETTARKRSVLRRREELLPTEVYTESDSYTSNICVSVAAIAILLTFVGILVLLDVSAIYRRMRSFCWPSVKQFMQRRRGSV